MPETPEQRARREIDADLTAASGNGSGTPIHDAEQAATVLSSRILLSAIQSTETIQRITNAFCSEDEQSELFAQFLFLCVHMSERAAQAKLPDEMARGFAGKLEDHVIGALMAAPERIPSPTRASIPEKLAVGMQRFHEDFGNFGIKSGSSGSAEGTVYYEFGKRIARVVGHANDAMVIAQGVGIAVNCVDAVQAPRVVGALFDSIRESFGALDEQISQARAAADIKLKTVAAWVVAIVLGTLFFRSLPGSLSPFTSLQFLHCRQRTRSIQRQRASRIGQFMLPGSQRRTDVN